MALKSTYSQRRNKVRNRPMGDIIMGGITALVGIAVISSAANAFSNSK